MLIGLLMAFGVLFALKRFKILAKQSFNIQWILLIPWVVGIIPGMVFYTETRFKIVSELLLFPFIGLVLGSVLSSQVDGKKHSGL